MRAPRGAVHVHTIGAHNVSETAQKVAKDVIAASTVQKRVGLPMPVETGDATGRVHSTATDEEFVELEADSKWMEGLQLNATGRKLCDYLGHVTSVLDDGDLGTECPIDQACSFRRVLIRALETKETPFGLSKKLPNFIAMVQLCGERMLLTTDRSQLFQLLAHAPSGPRANSNAINAMATMIKYQKEHPDHSLLLTYSAPFQVDLKHLWWDVRSIRRDPHTLKVVDGEQAYQIHEGKCRATGSTSALESPLAVAMLDKEVAAYEQRVTAVDLDVELSLAGGSGAGESQSKRVQTLEGLVARMQSDRKKMQEAHSIDVIALKKRADDASASAAEAAKMSYEQERESEESLNREIERLAKRVEESIKEVSIQKKDNEQLRKEHRSESAASGIKKDEEIKQLKSKIALLETSSKQATTELSRCNKAREAALKKQETGHTKSLDEMERKLGKLQMAERGAKQEAEELMVKLAALSTAMEGRDTEKELLQHDLKKTLAATRVLRSFLVLAGLRRETVTDEHTALADVLKQLDGANGKLKLHELAAGASSVEIKQLKDMVGDREAARDQMGEANARLQARVEELEKANVAQVEPAPPTPTGADAETMTVPITSEADLRLGMLETESVKLKDELVARQNECTQLKAELQRAKSKASKKQVPAGFVPEETKPVRPVLGVPSAQSQGYNQVVNVHVGHGTNGNSTAVASTDMGHATDIDPSVEHLIANAANALRVLADMSRDCSRHKAAACEGWAQARAMQNFTGYQMPQQQWPVQQQMQHPHSPNGYHAM